MAAHMCGPYRPLATTAAMSTDVNTDEAVLPLLQLYAHLSNIVSLHWVCHVVL